jgi:hypothetical protein
MHGILSRSTAIHFHSQEKRVHLNNFLICNADVWSHQKKSTPVFQFEYLIQFEAQTCQFLKFLAGHEVPHPSYCDCVPDSGSAMSAVVSFKKSPVHYIVGSTVVSFDWKVQCVTLLPSFKSDVTLHQNF